jgi:plastocyanin
MRHTLLLAISLAAFAAPAAAQAPTLVEVHLSNFKYAPQTIVLENGRSYVLRLVNDGGGGHSFTAPDFFAAATVEPDDRVWLTEGEVEVPGRLIRQIRFTAPATPARFKVKCTHAFHKMLGMSGWIVVR